MYVVLGISVLCIFMLAYPPTTYIIDSARGPISFRTEMGLAPFLVTMAVLGFFMSLGKAAVFKHIPVYYPNHVGQVGGAVGMVGGLGGFIDRKSVVWGRSVSGSVGLGGRGIIKRKRNEKRKGVK